MTTLFQLVFFIPLALCSVLGLAIAVTVGYVIVTAIYRVTFHPLTSYPGPKLWAASRIPITIFNLRGILPYEISKLHEKYGPVVRVAPNELSYIKEDAWADIYASRPQLKKDPGLGSLSRNTKGHINGILTAESDEDHGRMRRNFAHSFSDKSLREQESLITKYFDLLIQKLHERNGSPVDMTQWFNHLSFDIIGELTFGESFECLEKSTLHVWVQTLFTRLKMLGYFAIANRLSPLDRLMPYLLSSQTKAKAKLHSDFLAAKLEKRFSMKDPRPDFMTNVQQHMNTPTGMSYPEIRSTASTLIVAGSETTATLLSGLTFYLLRNPSKLSTLTQEIRSTFSSESEITMTSVNTLKFELACIQEGLRIFPPVPTNSYRLTPRDGAIICGEFVPGNILVGVPQFATNHSPLNFHDPDSFLPERWLDSSTSLSTTTDTPSLFSKDKRKAVQPFSVGPRNCLGRNLAIAEIRTVLARILWNFDLELCEESKDWIDAENMMPRVHVVWERTPLMVRLKAVVR